MADQGVNNIRDLLGAFISRRLVDITQHERDRRDAPSSQGEVFFHFDNGQTLHFWIDEATGFEILGADGPED